MTSKKDTSPPRTLSVDDVYARMDSDGKKMKPIPLSVFLPTALVGVPVWLLGVLPLTVTYQLAASVARPILEGKQSKTEKVESSRVELPTNVIPRDKRRYDVVLLGATGFTGGLASEYLAKTYGVNKEVKWAIAGRSQSKLENVKRRIAQETGQESALQLDTLLVDTNDLASLPTLVKDTRCIITTAGPFQRYGSNVVEYCAKYGTHYVDITGETEWVKAMMLKWDETAKQTGAKICNLCGHDSIPWDLTAYKLSQILREEKNEELISVACFNDVNGNVSGGTIETALILIEGKGIKAPKAEMDPLLKRPDGTKSDNCTKNNSPSVTIQPLNRPGRYASSWSMPFIMSEVNGAVVKRTNALNPHGSSRLQYREVRVTPDFKTAFVLNFGGIFGLTCLLNPFTRYFLKRILPKPGTGPSKEKMNRSYLCVTGEGLGANGSRVETAFYFPTDPGYKDTARMVVESGLALALDEKQLAAKTGGFWSPAAAMGDVLIDRLCRTGSSFASRILQNTENDGKLRSKL